MLCHFCRCCIVPGPAAANDPHSGFPTTRVWAPPACCNSHVLILLLHLTTHSLLQAARVAFWAAVVVGATCVLHVFCTPNLVSFHALRSLFYCYRAARVAFWAAIAVGATCVLHVALILLCRAWNRHPPPMLEFPRLELFMFMFVTQPVGQLAGRKSLGLLCFACSSSCSCLFRIPSVS